MRLISKSLEKEHAKYLDWVADNLLVRIDTIIREGVGQLGGSSMSTGIKITTKDEVLSKAHSKSPWEHKEGFRKWKRTTKARETPIEFLDLPLSFLQPYGQRVLLLDKNKLLDNNITPELPNLYMAIQFPEERVLYENKKEMQQIPLDLTEILEINVHNQPITEEGLLESRQHILVYLQSVYGAPDNLSISQLCEDKTRFLEKVKHYNITEKQIHKKLRKNQAYRQAYNKIIDFAKENCP